MKYILTIALLAVFTASFAQSGYTLPKQKDNNSQAVKSMPSGKVYNLDKVDEIETTNTEEVLTKHGSKYTSYTIITEYYNND